MKKFIAKILIAIAIVLAVSPWTGKYRSRLVNRLLGYEIYHSIDKSQQKHKAKTLVLGDSMGRQLYNNYNYNDSIYSLACNNAITLFGHYCLLVDFCEVNTDNLPEQVVLIYTPMALSNNLNEYAFQYFLKPMYTAHYKTHMNQYLQTRSKEVPLYWISQIPLIKYCDYAPRRIVPQTACEGLFSTINADYLDSITSFCRAKGIQFRLCSSIVNENSRDNVMKLIQNTHNIDTCLLNEYTESLLFWPNEKFQDDGIHLLWDIIPNDYLNLRN